MGKKLKFGILTLPVVSFEELCQQWKHIEELGFDFIWLPDHFVSYRSPTQNWFECWTLLSSLATRTTKARIGTLITSITLRHPAMLARQALTVDHISNGRLELGLGTGVSGKKGEVVYSMIGIDDWERKERHNRFKEIVEIIDISLRNPISSYEGQYYQLKDMAMYPESVQKPRPPITIASLSKRMLKIAAIYADKWNTFGGFRTSSSEELFTRIKKQSDLIDNYCKEVDRNPESLTRSILSYGSDAFSIFSSCEKFQNFVDKYSEIGITEFYFYYPFNSRDIPTFEKIAKEIIPEL